MAKRNFSLPGIQELSKEQEDARALPKEGRHLIIGGPGTGKSVLALLRSRRYHNDQENYIFLVYNRLLHQASRHLFGTNLFSQTWMSWFFELFLQETNVPVPRMPSNRNDGWRDIDWMQVREAVAAVGNRGSSKKRPYLIIDEGQDMPPEFYEILTHLGFENFYVVADQNQQIVSGRNSSRQDIENVLDISSEDVIELRKNYRNAYPTARLAREFYTGDPASPPPELPSFARPSAKRPVLLEYGSSGSTPFASAINAILKTADRDPAKLLGVLTPNNDVRQRYLQALTESRLQLDHGIPDIRTYANGEDPSLLTFDEGGIMVLNAQSCKGLEFDIVLLADIDQHPCNPTWVEETKRLFYVMVARARDYVVLLKNGDHPCPVDAIIPKNREILDIRRSQNGS